MIHKLCNSDTNWDASEGAYICEKCHQAIWDLSELSKLQCIININSDVEFSQEAAQ